MRRIIVCVIMFYAGFALGQSEDWKVLLHTGDSLRDLGAYEEALKYYERSEESTLLSHDSIAYANVLNTKGGIYFYMGRYLEAQNAYERSLVMKGALLGKQHIDYAETLNNLASLYHQMGLYDKAVLAQAETLNIVKLVLGAAHPYYRMSLHNLGTMYWQQGLYDKALALNLEVLALHEAIGDSSSLDYAVILNSLGLIYKDKGLYEQALACQLTSLSLIERNNGENNEQYAEALNNLALTYQEIGMYEKALPLQEKGLLITKSLLGEQHVSYAMYLNNLGSSYDNLGDTAKALALQEKSLALIKLLLGEQHPYYMKILNNIASIHESTGNIDRAITLQSRALALKESVLGKMHPSYAKSLNNLGMVYSSMGDYEKALSFQLEALNLNQKVLGDEHATYIVNVANVVSTYQALEDYEKMLPLLAKAIEQQLLNVHKYQSFLTVRERITSFKLLDRLLDTYYYNVCEFGGDVSERRQLFDYYLRNSSRVLSSMQRLNSLVASEKDSLLSALYEHWRDTKQYMYKQSSLPIASLVSRGVDMDALRTLSDSLVIAIGQRSQDAGFVFGGNNEVDWKAVQSKLCRKEGAIAFIDFPVYKRGIATEERLYYALLLRKSDNAPKFIRLGRASVLSKLLGKGVQINTHNFITDYSKSKALYSWVLEPLEPYISHLKTLHISSTGLLHQVPLGVLYSNNPPSVFQDKYSIHHYSSLKGFVDSRQSVESKQIVLIGDIDYDTPLNDEPLVVDSDLSPLRSMWLSPLRSMKFGKLEQTAQELSDIAALFRKRGNRKVLIYDKQSATEELFKSLDGTSFGILHLATHGFYLSLTDSSLNGLNLPYLKRIKRFDNPMLRSGLALSGSNHIWTGKTTLLSGEDGILTAAEVSNMNLRGTRLVVLSACNTGRGFVHGREGIFGLTRAFKAAGVEQLLVSLWKVPDGSTAELMALFYQFYLKSGDATKALRKAQRKMRKHHPNPYYWGGFVLLE